MIRITSTRDGFRRGGIAHPKGTVEYPDKTFSKLQLAAIQAEPVLTVEIIADKPKGKEK